jgi:hypothetical protein
MARLLGVSQSHWLRIRAGDHGGGKRVISAAAMVLPEIVRAALDEVQALRAGDADDGADSRGEGEATGAAR